ncbi:hypothetical protein ABEY24_19125 [Peribacillus frigoritolerans]|uniref:hypothetical protein n=1 Tax=Peribacillus frigoritolerans TaxID=450367 RepID=UPI003D27AD24
MKRKLMKVFSVIIATSIAIIGFGLMPVQKAEAATACDTTSGSFSICGSNAGSNVNASITITDPTYGRDYWTMYLQRYENGKWNTIGTRTGYIEWGSNSYRTFTNVAYKNAKTRINVKFYGDAAHTQFEFAVPTTSWIR